MKTSQNIYITTLLLLFGALTLSAQQSSTTFTPGYWTFGINGGWAYQSSDVKARFNGFGLGATLGKNLYYKPGAPLAFDLRGRFLYTQQYGLDGLRSYDLEKNTALNGTGALNYLNYPANLQEPRGFVFANHETTTAELALEGLFTFNRLRERTGVHLGLYGGIGLNWYRAEIDQADALGSEYFEDYANLNDNKSISAVRNDLRNILDGTYETLADGNVDDGSIKFMPSLGFELGYQLSPNFLLYCGHRLTFSGTDALDGQRFEDPNNDLYHYTNLGLRWTIQPKEEKALSPVIDIILPLGSPYTTNSPTGLVIANIRHINSAADVDCIINGRSVGFSFDKERFSLDTPLKSGSNEVTIIARNAVGQDRKSLILVYNEEITPPREEVARPRVRFNNPYTSSTRTEDDNFDIRATIENVNDRNDVTFTLNGSARNFSFSNGELRANIPLREGENVVKIQARNSAGADAAEVSIIRALRILPPTVDITEPTGSRVESAADNIRLSAQVRHVENKSDIRLVVNGRDIWNFEYDKGYLTAAIDLESGANTVVVTAGNSAGTARDEVTIVYREPVVVQNPPQITFIQPNRASSSTTQLTASIEALVKNVPNRSNIVFLENGSRRYDFNFDTKTGRLTTNVNLLLGNNEITIRATNQDGEAEQGVAIRRIKEEVRIPRPPVVRITTPANNSETQTATVDVRAQIEQVSSKSDIALVINGRNSADFSYNASSGQLTARLPLLEGNNTIQIRATNQDGTDDALVNVRYRKVSVPVVQILDPSNNSESTLASTSLRARVEEVLDKSQIRLIVNGKGIPGFTFDPNRNEVKANVTLLEGNNTIRVEAKNEAGEASDLVNVHYRSATPPKVSISAPANNSTSEIANISLRATVQNVKNRSEVTVRLNGSLISDFNLNLASGDLNANINLKEGNNTMTVRASNADGTAEASVNVRYQPLQKPVVRITDPASSPFTITQNNYAVKAAVQHIESKTQLNIRVNGTPTTLYNFDLKTGELTVRAINLKEGDNAVSIRATNNSGSAEASVVLHYSLPKPPTVSITEPQNGSTTEQSQLTVKATIAHVSSKKSVVFKVNGLVANNFELNGEQFTGTALLKSGENAISISAQNQDGSAEATTKVTFKPKVVMLLKPEVQFTAPLKSGVTVKEKAYTVKANLINVAAMAEITLWVNGEIWGDFDFDPKNRQLSAAIELQNGENIVKIKAQNKGGSDEEARTIVYKAENQNLPAITIISVSQPTVNPLNPQVGRSTVIAKVTNIKGKENVKIFVNDQELNDFSYDISSNMIQTVVSLKRGKNKILIRASNTEGTAEESREIEF